MLSGVLHSDRAIKVNIQIMRVFTRMRKLLEAHKEILTKLDDLEKREIEQDEKIMLISRPGIFEPQDRHEAKKQTPSLVNSTTSALTEHLVVFTIIYRVCTT